jgi:hypothetical protein
MITAYKIDPAYLEQKQAEYQSQLGEGVPLLPKFVAQTAKIVAREPQAYLRYGPYWWAVKRILIAHDVNVGGTYMEPMWADEYACATPELTLIAAWEFGDDATGRFGVQTREYDLTDDMTLMLYDPDLEEPK